MLSKLRSLRARIALFATLTVSAALIAASLGLVFAVERTLVGRHQKAAIEELDRVAAAVGKGEDPDRPVAERANVLVQIFDENGDLVGTVPETGIVLRGTSSVGQRIATVSRVGPGSVRMITRRPSDGAIAVRQLEREELILAERSVTSPEGERTIVAVSPFSGVARSIETIINTLWLGIPILILFVGFVSWHFTGRMLRPVGAIARRAEEISDSNLAERLPQTGTGDEIDRLATTLNSMLARLEDAARRHREFVSDASHELWSPISIIRTQLEVALANPEQADWEVVARDALTEGERLERLVEDLLFLARAEERDPPRRPVQLEELVKNEILRLRDPRISLDVKPVAVQGDPHQLAKVIANLLANARRHAKRRIEVTLKRDRGRARLSVDDDGPGVPPFERERIFDRFTRLDEARTQEAGGLGIGLALVSRIVGAHGGAVGCSGSDLGGARFEVTFPLISPGGESDNLGPRQAG
jgi:signal transduction histidine kinase